MPMPMEVMKHNENGSHSIEIIIANLSLIFDSSVSRDFVSNMSAVERVD